jgi:hypothetical protein
MNGSKEWTGPKKRPQREDNPNPAAVLILLFWWRERGVNEYEYELHENIA